MKFRVTQRGAPDARAEAQRPTAELPEHMVSGADIYVDPQVGGGSITATSGTGSTF